MAAFWRLLDYVSRYFMRDREFRSAWQLACQHRERQPLDPRTTRKHSQLATGPAVYREPASSYVCLRQRTRRRPVPRCFPKRQRRPKETENWILHFLILHSLIIHSLIHSSIIHCLFILYFIYLFYKYSFFKKLFSSKKKRKYYSNTE